MIKMSITQVNKKGEVKVLEKTKKNNYLLK